MMSRDEYKLAVKAVALLKRVRPDLAPYIISVDVMAAWEGRLSAENSDIEIEFKAPVTGACYDVRSAHASLKDMTDELKNWCQLDPDSVGDEGLAAYDAHVLELDMTAPAYSFNPVVDGELVGYPESWRETK